MPRCPGSWWCCNANRRNRVALAKFSRTDTLAKTGNFWLLEVRVPSTMRARGTVSRNRAELEWCSESSRQAGIRRTVVGWRSQSGRRCDGTWRPWTWSRLRPKLDWTGASWYRSWSATCSRSIRLQSRTTRESQQRAQPAQFSFTFGR